MTETVDPIFVSPPSPQRIWRRRAGLLTAAVVLTAGVVWGSTEILGSCGAPWSGVNKVDGECIGVTDGSYVFHAELADVQRRIAAENARVRAESSFYVTVALLEPLSPTSDSALPPAQVRNRLEGAYTALRRVNSTSLVGDSRPQIQLVLASEGNTPRQQQRVIDSLTRMRDQEEHRLIAVIGLGVSTEQTRRQAEKLSERGFPLVGALLTADTLNYDSIPGLIKTSPSNRHYVEALRGYVDSTDLKSAIMVRDSNSDSGADLFTKTLAENFQQQMRHMIKFPTQQFTGVSIPTDADPRLFAGVRANICASTAQGLQAIFYAGREVDLDSFIESLANRTCHSTPLTILTAGSDIDAVLKGHEDELRKANLMIVDAGTVDPEGWGRNVPGTPEYYNEFLSAFQEQGFDPGHLDDGGAIMMHDALLTITQAVRLAAPKGSESSPTADGVRAQLLNLNGEYAIPGASGKLNFSFSSAVPGNPVGKPLPVLQYPHPADSSSRQVGPLYFVKN